MVQGTCTGLAERRDRHSHARCISVAPRIPAATIDLSEVVSATVRSYKGLAEDKQISLRQELQGEVVVNSDADACREAIAILLDNAIKYTPAGGEVVLSTSKSGTEALVEVRDTGIGMTREEVIHATDRFYRSDKARTRSDGGAGLGLPIAKELVAALNGGLELESEPCKGTIARLRLRLAPRYRFASA